MTTYQLSIVLCEFVIIGVRIKHHLGIGVDGQIRFDGRQVAADKIHQGLGLFLRLCSSSTVSFITGIWRGSYF